MPRYPEATWRPVDRYQSGSLKVAMPEPTRFILHTAVSDATPSLHHFFNVPGRATPHFYVGRDGEVEQYIDTGFRSSANLDGNPTSITVETWDGFGTGWTGSDVPPWTDAQLESLAALVAWCHETHDIPLAQLPSSRPGTRGIGWHRQGCDGNFPPGLLAGRPPDGERWSESGGKVCPGDNRIRQVERIIARASEISIGVTEMNLNDTIGPESDVRIGQVLRKLNNFLERAPQQQEAIVSSLTELDDAIAALPDDTDVETIRRVVLEQSGLTRRRVKAAFAEAVDPR